jgi:serine/threonine-protein kinase
VCCNLETVGWLQPEQTLNGALECSLRLLCLRDGEPVALEIPTGVPTGLACRPTAYPLVTHSSNRVRPGTPIEVDPGSYLLLARRAGYETQRFPVAVPRLSAAAPTIALELHGTTPPGFVHIAAGPFVRGGDSQARFAGPAEEVHVDGFFIAEKEVTNAEWFAFVNDPRTLETITAASTRRIYLPRETSKLLVKPLEDGTYIQSRGVGDTAVYGISWNDTQAFLRWRNDRAAASGEPWIYDLPTGDEWEKAARGVDGRAFPWGDRLLNFSL